MLPRPQCFKRRCRHFIGVKQPDRTEATEVVVCNAFPEGIPEVIAFGNDKHIQPFPGDNGIQYEKEL